MTEQSTADAQVAIANAVLKQAEAVGFDLALGVKYIEVSPDGVTAQFTITPAHFQPWGIVHGGVYAAVIESVSSVSAQVWLGDRGRIVGVNNNTDFLRAVSEGTLTATSTPIHRGRRQQLWLVVITSADGKTIARGQVRIQNIDN